MQYLANTVSSFGQSDQENMVSSLNEINGPIRRGSGKIRKNYKLKLHKITAKLTRLD